VETAPERASGRERGRSGASGRERGAGRGRSGGRESGAGRGRSGGSESGAGGGTPVKDRGRTPEADLGTVRTDFRERERGVRSFSFGGKWNFSFPPNRF